MEEVRESWTDKRLDEFRENTDRRFDAIDHRFDIVDQRFEAIDERFEAIDQRFEAIDQRFEAIDQRFDAIDHRFDAADQRFEAFERGVGESFTRVDNDLRELRSQMAAFQRMVFQLCGGMIVTVAVGFAGLILSQL
jgi:hypothetical protein